MQRLHIVPEETWGLEGLDASVTRGQSQDSRLPELVKGVSCWLEDTVDALGMILLALSRAAGASTMSADQSFNGC